jgi:putative ABC transport system permease protein
MNLCFYPRLAWEGIRKNKRMYFPYILTGSVMVMMFYILSFLEDSPALTQMNGGTVLVTILPLGCIVIAVFSLLFLFYTNSFLIKQRYREFGLYNILGMDKRNISRLMVWETAFTAILALIIGLVAGIALSKGAELILLNLLGMDISYTLGISILSVRNTAVIFAAIYMVLLVNSLIQIRRSKPLELLHSSKVGEKVPKFTWLFAAVGILLLGCAYYIAVSIEEPITALSYFFIAVIMVIAGTYLLFISGSVTFCRLLQKNKRYYYKPNHFVSVSSMVYRMKRNGAGLASICILLTMVLVMLSSTTTLYFGEEDAIKNRYPNCEL